MFRRVRPLCWWLESVTQPDNTHTVCMIHTVCYSVYTSTFNFHFRWKFVLQEEETKRSCKEVNIKQNETHHKHLKHSNLRINPEKTIGTSLFVFVTRWIRCLREVSLLKSNVMFDLQIRKSKIISQYLNMVARPAESRGHTLCLILKRIREWRVWISWFWL